MFPTKTKSCAHYITISLDLALIYYGYRQQEADKTG